MKIEDIFSKKTKEKKKIIWKVTIDTREKNSLVASELMHLGASIEFEQLPVADYLVNGVAIERKTVSDFISSMLNKRLSKQIEDLQQYGQKIILIEGLEEQELYDDQKIDGVHANAIRGFLLSIMINHKIPILFTKDYKDTAKFIQVLAKKKLTESGINAKKRVRSVQEQLQYIIEGFPGIGPKSAKKLLEKFHNIKSIANASQEELEEILGKKAESMKKLLDEKY